MNWKEFYDSLPSEDAELRLMVMFLVDMAGIGHSEWLKQWEEISSRGKVAVEMIENGTHPLLKNAP